MRRIAESAIVLQRYPLGESDWRLVFLGAESGKYSAVAPGARRSKKRFSGMLDLFSELDLVVVDRGRGGLMRLEEARLLDGHVDIRSDLVGIAHAGYATELVAGLLREGQEAQAAYELLRSALRRLEQGPMTTWDLRRLELSLLQQAGVGPSLDLCLECGREQARGWYFDFDQGGLVCGSCPAGPHRQALVPATVELLRALQGGAAMPEAGRAGLGPMRSLLGRLVDLQVGRPLKAREFLRQLARSSTENGG